MSTTHLPTITTPAAVQVVVVTVDQLVAGDVIALGFPHQTTDVAVEVTVPVAGGIRVYARPVGGGHAVWTDVRDDAAGEFVVRL